MGQLRQAFIFVVILLLVVVIGLSIALYYVQSRHSRIITEESYTVQRLEIVDRATLLMAEQREAVVAMLIEPFDRASFKDETETILQLINSPILANSRQGRRRQQEILREQRQFSQMALRLPRSPTRAQVQVVREQGEVVFSALNAFRTTHAVNLATLRTSEIEQRRLGLIMIITTNGVIVLLALAGFALLNRLGRQQSEFAALRATDKLRREFIAFTAHELRNPTGAILTGISLLQEPDLEPEIRQQVIESITRSADALNRLIFNLLAMGRSEQHKLQLNRTAIGLDSLIGSVITELAVYHPGIEKRVKHALPDVPVDVDPEYMKLVISNIIDNGVKYSPPQSPITISAETDDRQVTVHIHNNGPGIPPEELPKIFEMYETSGTAPYSLRRGVGLGLYMARLLIEAHGGTIWAESQPDEGATFSFTLPRA